MTCRTHLIVVLSALLYQPFINVIAVVPIISSNATVPDFPCKTSCASPSLKKSNGSSADDRHLNTLMINNLYSATCTENNAKGVKCVPNFVESTVSNVVDNDTLPEIIASETLSSKDDLISAYHESSDGLSKLQVLSLKDKGSSEDDAEEDDDITVEILNGKCNGKKINGAAELDELENADNKKIKIPVYGTMHDFAYYFIKVYIGSPRITQWVVLDTGSNLFAITCGHGIKCGSHQNANYLPINSRTSVSCLDSKRCKLKGCGSCKFMQRYSEGSFISGEYYSDIISFTDSSKGYHFDNIGCILYENKLIFNQKANGIFGMSINGNTILSQLFNHSNMSKMFSLCLSDEGGELIVGGVESKYFNNKDDMAWTRLHSDENYSIYINGMSYLNNKVEFTSKKFSIDSGTTNTLLSEDLYKPIIKGVLNKCFKDREVEGEDLDIGIKIIDKIPIGTLDVMIEREENVTKCEINNDEICSKNIGMFSPIYFKLDGGDTLTIGPETYFFKRNGWWCLGIEKSVDGENILGATFFRNKQLIFTKDKLGIIPSQCPSHTINV